MLKDTVSIDVQGFFDNNKNFILKEIGIGFEKLLNTKSRRTAIWLTNTNHKIFWNDGENSFPQTIWIRRGLYRRFLGVVSSLISRK